MVSQWGLNESKSPQVSRTHHSILADLHDALVWMVYTPLVFKALSSCTNPLVSVQSVLIIIGITVTSKFYY